MSAAHSIIDRLADFPAGLSLTQLWHLCEPGANDCGRDFGALVRLLVERGAIECFRGRYILAGSRRIAAEVRLLMACSHLEHALQEVRS